MILPNKFLFFLSFHSQEMGISLSEQELVYFKHFMKELKEWNKRINLTSINSDEDIVIKHFIDSLTPLRFIKQGSRVLDIGSGAGFPGIPLKIAAPSISMTLLDSVNKKVTFMKHMIDILQLGDIQAIHGRAEDLVKNMRGEFDVVISRALGKLDDFVSLGEPFLAGSGQLIAMKGKNTDEEVAKASRIMEQKGLRVKEKWKFSLPLGAGERGIIVLERKL